MSEERLEAIEFEQRGMRAELSQHSQQIAVLNSQIPLLQRSLDANTEALRSHATVLNEYSGARKAVHWIVTTIAALGAYFFGTQGKG
jgi:chromosome segregation ATPase